MSKTARKDSSRPEADSPPQKRPAPQPFNAFITVARKDLAKALAAIVPAVERNASIPVLGGVLFDCETGCIRLGATNLDQWLGASIVAQSNRPIKFVLLEPHGLAKLLKLLDGEDVTLTVANRADVTSPVLLKSGDVEAELRTLPWEDFPMWPHKSTPTDLHFGGPELLRAIDRVEYAISTEETRYYLNGIYLHGRPNAAGTAILPWMAATDGCRLALALVEDEIGQEHPSADDTYAVIIPRSTVPMLKTYAQRGAVDMRLGDTSIEIEQEAGPDGIGYTLYSKLIDGTYPDYQRVIPRGNSQHCVLSPSTIIPAIKRTDTLRREKTRALKITVETAEITLMMRDVSGGQVRETIELPEPATQRFEHGVNGKYLAEVLGSFSGAVRYCWADPASPIVIYSADVPPGPQGIHLHTEATHLAVLMPMRV